MKKLKQGVSLILSLLIICGITVIGIPAITTTASAAEISTGEADENAAVGDSGLFSNGVTVKIDAWYSATPRMYCTLGSGLKTDAFCTQPAYSPGFATKHTFESKYIKAVTNSIARNILYYGYNGPGFNTTSEAFNTGSNYAKTSKGAMLYFRKKYHIFENTLSEEQFLYSFTHYALSYALYGELSSFGNKYDTVNYPYKDGVTDYVNNAIKSGISNKLLDNKSAFLRAYLIDWGTTKQNIIFPVYRMRLKFSKKSSNPSFTNSNSAYSLSGAHYALFTDKNAALAALKEAAGPNSPGRLAGALKQNNTWAYIETDANGDGKFYHFGYGSNGEKLATADINNYYAIEYWPPMTDKVKTGYAVSNTLYGCNDTGEVDENGYPIYVMNNAGKSVVEEPQLVIQMTKQSGNTSITNGNSCYSLEGAEYGIYTNSACTQLVGTIITDKNGNGTYLDGKPVEGKNYWAKETKASPGYLLDEEVHKLTYSGKRNSDGFPIYSFTSTEMPDSDPMTVLLQKYDATAGKGTNTEKMANALFEVKFYPKEYASVEEIGNESPMRTWVFKTNTNGVIQFDIRDKVSGDDFWYDEGVPCIPYGTITVQETQAPTGYQINPEIYLANIGSGGEKISWRTANENVDNSVLQVPETQNSGGLQIRKKSTDNKVSGIWFRVAATDGSYSKDFCTNASGLITNSELNELPAKTYKVTELGVKEGSSYRFPRRYGTAPAPQTVTLETGKTKTVSFNNKTTPTELRVYKEAVDERVSGIWFEVTSSDNTVYPKIVTDSSGFATLKNLPMYDDNDNVITYTVKELGELKSNGTYEIPTRYRIPADQSFDFTENVTTSGGKVIKEITVVNELRKGMLDVQKYTSPNTYDSVGMCIKLSNDSGFSQVKTVSARSNKLRFENLDVFDSEGQLIEYTLEELGYYDSANNKYNYPKHFYKHAPIKFYLSTASTNGDMVYTYRTMTNKVKNVKLKINKFAPDNDVSNIWFSISSNPSIGNARYIVTNSQGVATDTSLPIYTTDGTLISYTIRERGIKIGENRYQMPEKYVNPGSRTFTLEDYDDDNEYAEFDFTKLDPTGTETHVEDIENTPKYGNLSVQKVSDDGIVEGFYFNVKSGSGSNVKNYGNFATDSNGTVLFTNLPIYEKGGDISDPDPIEYTVTELGFKNPDGTYYIPNRYVKPDPQTVTLSYNPTIDSITYVTVSNHLQPGAIKIVKVADDNKVDNIYFRVKNVSTQVSTIYKTNSQGVILIKNLPVVDNGTFVKYYIVELGEKQSDGTYKIPDRYKPPSPVQITLSAGETSEVRFNNSASDGYVAIEKTRTGVDGTIMHLPDETYHGDYPDVAGAKIGIYTDFQCTNKVGETVSGDDGYALFGPLPFGNYYIKEIEAPPGYFKSNQVLAVQIFRTDPDDAKEHANFTLGNTPASFYVHKFDETYDGETDPFEAEGLSGCTIEVRDSHNNLIDDWVTDGTPHEVTGRKYNRLVYVGETYTIKETNPADGYSVKTITYTVKELTEVVSVDPRTGQQRETYENYNDAIMINSPTETYVSKLDTVNNLLPGARMQVLDENNAVMDEWTSTIEPHRILGLVAGKTYKLVEVSPPDGYIASNSVDFTVDYSEPTYVNMVDSPTQVQFIKVDSSGNNVSGVVLQILDGNSLIDEWTTDGSPHTLVGILAVNKEYTLREKSAPANYTLAPDQTFTVRNKSEMQKVTVTNEFTETYITKTEITGQTEIAGARLVVRTQSGTKVDEWTSTTEPHLITGLERGQTYTLTETIAPEGYLIAKSIEFKVKSDGTATNVKMKDDSTKIKLEKVDENGQRVSGARLQVLDENNNVIDEWTSSASSDRDITARLVVGKTYRLHEVSSPSTYALSEDVSFKVKNTGKLQTVTMVDHLTETYISKTEITGTSEISGAHLTVSVKNGSEVESWVSTSEPHIIKGLVKGQTYVLTETQSPNGYTTTESVEFTVNSDGTPTNVVMRDDTTKIKITKVDENGNRVAGVRLRIVDENNKNIETWLTNGTTDKVITGKLIVGKTYTLKELTAPAGYVKASDITFTVKNVNTVQTIKMTNKLTKTYISKQNVTNSSELPGAHLSLSKRNGALIEEWVSTTEPHLVEGLSPGTVYVLTETLPPDGYTTATPIEFTINSDYSATHVTMLDETTKVIIRKVDKNGNAVKGVTLQLFDENRNLVSTWTTTSNGAKLFSGKLIVGKTYTLHELSAPPQYVLAEDVSLTIQDTTEVQNFVMTNMPTLTYISKTDITGDTELEGAHLEVTDSDGNVVDEWTSTTQPHLIEGLNGGQTYTLTETIAPNGYTIANSIQFTVNSDGTPTQVKMTDDTTKLKFVKKNAEGNRVKDVVLQVLDSKKNVVDEWTTDGKTDHIIEGVLIVGQKYVLHEVSAPIEYTLASDKSFTVQNVNTVQTITMTNNFKVGNVTLNKSDSNGKIDGSTWELYDSDNKLVNAVEVGEGIYTYSKTNAITEFTTSQGTLKIQNLPLGDYYFREISPPSDSYFPYQGKVPFTISAEDDESLNPEVNIKNNHIVGVNTGGNGNIVFYVISGVSLMLFAAVIYTIKKHNKRKRER